MREMSNIIKLVCSGDVDISLHHPIGQEVRRFPKPTSGMNWYIAKIVFRISAGRNGKPQFDEHLRLLTARDFEEAFLKARMLGIREEDTFLNTRSETVKWEFINVAELHPLTELKDGSELYSQIHETEEAAEYIDLVHQRAVIMQTQEQPHL